MRKQSTSYVVRDVRLSSGERLPVIYPRATGIPLFEPTLYALTELRGRNRSTSTIHQALRAVMVLELVLDQLGIDLTHRLRDCRLLDLGEVEELARACRLPIEDLGVGSANADAVPEVVTSLETVRMRRATRRLASPVISSESAAIRLHYIRGYLQWRVNDRLLRLGSDATRHALLKSNADAALQTLQERIPGPSHKSADEQREGLSPEQLDRLIEVIQPDSPDNPWTGDFARQRNFLMAMWVLALGVRRGELLGVRIDDVSFQRNEVFIARRPDDPEDPRTAQPRAKTLARMLPLHDLLAAATRRYVIEFRRMIPSARKNRFLFVATGTGAPLSLAALTKIGEKLRTKCEGLPRDFAWHVLRHTHAELITNAMDAGNIPSEVEVRVRARLMGWVDGSKMAAVYTRRHTRRKANSTSLDLQSKLLEPTKK